MSVRRYSPLLALALAATFAHGQARKFKNYDLVDVSYRITMDARSALVFGDCTNTLTLEENTDRVAFDFAKLGIGSVTVDGRPATFRMEGEVLWVNLPAKGSKGQKIKVRIVYGGAPEAGIYFVPATRAYPSKTPMVYTQGEAEDTRYWLPTYDDPDDKATSEAWLEVPRDWTAIGNGRLVDTSFRGTNVVYHWKMEQPHATYLNSIVAGPYVEKQEMWDSLPVSYFVPPGLEKEGEVAFAGTNEMIAFYSKLTGLKYPYAKFAQSVVSDYMFGGMENITAVTQTIGTLHPAESEPLSSSKGLVLHELAHQWFGDTITCHDWSHIWLNEGFATFLPHFWAREHEGEDTFELQRYDTFQGAIGAMASEPRPVVNPTFEVPMDNFDGHAYAGGATRMFMLMDLLGEKQFWASIKKFLDEYKFKSLTTEQFFDSVTKSSGKDLTQFKKQWFYTPAMPKLALNKTEKGFEIAPDSNSQFVLSVPIWIWKNGAWLKSNVTVSNKPVTLEGVEGLALIDPAARLAANVSYNASYSDPEWADLYRNLPDAAGKARLIDLFRATNRQPLLANLVASEKNVKILPRLINACDTLPDQLCVDLFKSPDPFVRQAAISQMGKKTGNVGLTAVLRVAMASEENPQLKLAMFSAIYSITKDMGMIGEAWRTESWGDAYRAFGLEMAMSANPDVARDMCLEALSKPMSEPLRQNAVRKLGTLKDKPGERKVFDALIKVVQENSFGARNGAISSLAAYGDPKALPYIRPLAKHSLFFIARTATAAIKQLGG